MTIKTAVKKKKEKEYEPAKKFSKFYAKKCNLTNVRLIRLHSNSKTPSPDYLISKLNVYLEVKELRDRVDTEHSARFWKITSKIKSFLERNPLYKKVTGLYLLEPPHHFKYPHDDKSMTVAGGTILQAILDGDKEVVLKNNVRITIAKVGENKNYIGFGNHYGGSVSPEHVIFENIKDNLVTANGQLQIAANKGKKGIVLLANRYVHANHFEHIYGGLSLGIDQLVQLRNIDEVWFEQSEKGTTFELIYEKQFFDNLMRGVLLRDPEHIRLFEKWIYHLDSKKWPHQHQLFQSLQHALKDIRPDVLFTDRFARQRMVELGKQFAEKGEYDKPIWLIEKFKDDCHPPLVPIEGEKDYEQEIRNGGTVNAITSVVGQVVWLTKELIHNKQTISKALDYIAELARHKSLYVKTHCTYALADMANGRSWLTGYGKFPREGECQKFHEIVFYLLDVVKQNPSCFALINRMVDLFGWYRDLTEAEAIDVLETLNSTTESVDLFIHFALYRHEHAKKAGYQFDPTVFKEKLKKLIIEKDASAILFRPALAQSIWRILLEEKSEFETLRPYVVMLFECDYEEKLFPILMHLLEEVYKLDRELGFALYKKSFETLYRSFKEAGSTSRISLWLPADFMKELAGRNPNEYLDLMKKLAVLWEKGGNFGHFESLFLPFQEIIDDKQREQVRKDLSDIYLKMLSCHPFINNTSINQALKIEVSTDLVRINSILSNILEPSLISAVPIPPKISEMEKKYNNDERFHFLYRELFGKVTLETSKQIDRYLSPIEIGFISRKLKSYLKRSIVK